MAFASATDLATYLNTTFTDAEADQANLLLDIATGAIQGWTGQTIEFVNEDSAVLRGNWSSVLELPERPVVDITSVAIDGTALTEDTTFVWDGSSTLYRGRRETQNDVLYPYPDRSQVWWGGPSAKITVVYDHGFSIIPLDVVGVCLDLAARGINSPAGVRQEQLGPYSVTYDMRSAASRLTSDDRRQLRWLKR